MNKKNNKHKLSWEIDTKKELPTIIDSILENLIYNVSQDYLDNVINIPSSTFTNTVKDSFCIQNNLCAMYVHFLFQHKTDRKNPIATLNLVCAGETIVTFTFTDPASVIKILTHFNYAVNISKDRK